MSSSNLRNRKEKILVWEAPVIALVRVLRSFFVILVKNTKISRNIWWQKLNTHILYIMWTCAKEKNHKTQPPVSPTASNYIIYNTPQQGNKVKSSISFFCSSRYIKKSQKVNACTTYFSRSSLMLWQIFAASFIHNNYVLNQIATKKTNIYTYYCNHTQFCCADMFVLLLNPAEPPPPHLLLFVVTVIIRHI